MESQKLPQKKEDERLPTPKQPPMKAPVFSTPSSSSAQAYAVQVFAKALTSPGTTISVVVPTTTTGGTVIVSTKQSTGTALPKPPPLVAAVSSVPSVTQEANGSTASSSTSGSSTIISSIGSTKTPQKLKAAEVPQTSTEAKPKELPTLTSAVGSIKSNTSGGGGGLGAGKPKAFLALMASATKKQLTKKVPPSKANKGQKNKSKAPLSTPVLSKKGGENAPSRTSNRSIKRPRTYDEELDDLKALKPSSSKKAKGPPKVS